MVVGVATAGTTVEEGGGGEGYRKGKEQEITSKK